VIRRFDVKTPGRTEVTANADDKTDSELATEIITLLGGAHNIDSVGACITRLRLEVAKSDAWIKTVLTDSARAAWSSSATTVFR
jgi:PTS system D-glucosamine-specific IIC component